MSSQGQKRKINLNLLEIFGKTKIDYKFGNNETVWVHRRNVCDNCHETCRKKSNMN